MGDNLDPTVYIDVFTYQQLNPAAGLENKYQWN